MESEVYAATLQLKELQSHYQRALDAELAMQLFSLQHSWDDQQACAPMISSSSLVANNWELQQLSDQFNSLANFIRNYEDRKAANSLQTQEAAHKAAYDTSLRLADCIAAQEARDRHICDHDAAFARMLSRCDSEDWDERGDLLANPLRLPPRPRTPELNSAPMLTSGVCNELDTPACDHNNCVSGSTASSRCDNSSNPRTAVGVRSTGQPGSSSSSGTSSTQHKTSTSKQPMLAPSAGCSHSCSRDTASDTACQTDQNKSRKGSEAQSQCGICFDSFPTSSMIAALLPQQQASSSAAHGRCGHFFCQGCMRSYVQEELKARHYPLSCPMPACQEVLGHNDILQLLSGRAKELQVYDILVMENSIDASLRVYCPYKDCSCLLERPEDDGGDEAFECPSCHRVFCGSCGVAGWHTGMTCQQFQALPPELRSVEDAAMLRMAAAQSWKRCPAPGCGHVVERTEGCNHMRCRCGVDFCYACGKQYRSAQPTAENAHGTPACGCPLFAVPEEVEVEAPAPRPAVVLRPARPRPWRGGRMVSRTRCWHSSSVYDCPQGPERCCFWHDEDDDH